MVARILLFILTLFIGYAYASELDSTTDGEILHLFDFINASECEFNRNGLWYDATKAAKHIRRKYEYALGKGLIDSTEDFIAYAASKSSMSGKKYIVQCGDSAEVFCSEWLSDELMKYRSSKKLGPRHSVTERGHP